MALFLIAIPPTGRADEPKSVEPPLTVEQQSALTKSFEKSLADANKLIEADSKNTNAHSRRGDAHFFLGKFDEAVADYDQMVQLDEKLGDSHWRRGIAFFYAGRFKDAAAQFESYHSFDQVDRENGIWRYLSQHKAHGHRNQRHHADAGLGQFDVVLRAATPRDDLAFRFCCRQWHESRHGAHRW